MLMDYKGNVTVKIDGIAASAASVIAMAGNNVMMSPVSMLMIHNPATVAMGDHNEMQKAIEMLEEVKESIINAYEIKTGMSRAKLARLMEEETWMNAKKAVELGFADSIIEPDKKINEDEKEKNKASDSILFSRRAVSVALQNKLKSHYLANAGANTGTDITDLEKRLNLLKPLGGILLWLKLTNFVRNEQKSGNRQKHFLIPTETKPVFFRRKIPQLMKRWKRILLTSVTRLSVSKKQTTLKES